MTQNHTKKLVFSALFAAVICVATAIVGIPLPNGFANLGDCFVLLAGVALGPVWGTLAAGVGSALADLFLGFTVYAPATLVIKALMALCVWAICSKMKAPTWLRILVGVVAAECVMVGGYLAFEWILYGAGALASVVGNTMQGVVGGVAASLLMPILQKQKRFF